MVQEAEPTVEDLCSVAPLGDVCWGRYRGKKVAEVERWACMWVRAREVLSEVEEGVLRGGG